MFLSRKIGALFRGRATRIQILLGAVLGGMLAFLPGFAFPDGSGGDMIDSIGSIVALITLALFLDANFAVLGLTLLVGKLLSVPLLPISFEVGTWFLDGPVQGVFRFLINAPATAWFGLQSYSVTGGLAVGLLFGLGFGYALWRGIDATRRKAAELDENSDRWKAITSKPMVRFLTWLFLGKGKGKKKSWEELAERGRAARRPVRWTGLGAGVVLILGLGLLSNQLGGAWFEDATRIGLTQWNGATADLGSARAEFLDGRLVMRDLALADPEDLETNDFQARDLEFDIDAGALFARRVVIQRLAITEAAAGERRAQPARRLGEEPGAGGAGGGTGGAGGGDPIPPEEESSTRGFEDVIEDVELWKGRLETAQRWIDRLFGDEEESSEEERKSAREVLGLATIIAEHLIDQEPSVLVEDVLVEGLSAKAFGESKWKIEGKNLSSHPSLVGPARLTLKSDDGLNAIALERDAEGTISIDLGLDGTTVASLKEAMPWLPLDGGTIDFALKGALSFDEGGAMRLDLPLDVKLKGTTMSFGGQSAPLELLELPIEISGPFTSPNFHVDSTLLLAKLQEAGATALVNGLASEFGVSPDLLNKIRSGQLDVNTLQDAGQNLLEKTGLGGELNKATEDVKKQAGGLLKGLLPGRKK